jgi:hypothetical protein
MSGQTDSFGEMELPFTIYGAQDETCEEGQENFEDQCDRSGSDGKT